MGVLFGGVLSSGRKNQYGSPRFDHDSCRDTLPCGLIEYLSRRAQEYDIGADLLGQLRDRQRWICTLPKHPVVFETCAAKSGTDRFGQPLAALLDVALHNSIIRVVRLELLGQWMPALRTQRVEKAARYFDHSGDGDAPTVSKKVASELDRRLRAEYAGRGDEHMHGGMIGRWDGAESR